MMFNHFGLETQKQNTHEKILDACGSMRDCPGLCCL